MKKKNKKNQKKPKEKSKKFGFFSLSKLNPGLPDETKKWIWGIVIFILAVIVALSFFEKAGGAGKEIKNVLTFLFGNAVFALPLILVLGGLVFFSTKYEKFLGPVILAISLLIIGISGLLSCLTSNVKAGGWLGYFASWPFLKLFDTLVTQIIFAGVILIGGLIFWHLLKRPSIKEGLRIEKTETEKKPSLIKKIFAPKFKIKEVEPRIKEVSTKTEEPDLSFKSKQIFLSKNNLLPEDQYKIPPLDLLETDKGKPSAGDTASNSAIIKKTLENFGLHVEMSEINIGPTVTQYTLKPAEGVKLSKITALSNNLSLALASHPIRIEAPIPGKALVGIEVPNKERCQIRLRDLISARNFQETDSNLAIVLGKDVSGSRCYADLVKMPHLLVAGATGTGKTIFLNSLILSLLYQNSPKTLRLILIDPKRVEFSAFRDLPHLLAPVIFDAQKTINALHWLTSEMDRRFDIFSENGSRNISSYNEKLLKAGGESLPYIILIIDELADLMAARGRDVEAGIVRLAQMSRAVGIHLVVATQRPSVEVITGLIKANITSRITFQVASQVDSRTVLDVAGAEKLLGMGDLLFISADIVKPKRIQGPYVTEKEIKKVVDYVKDQTPKIEEQGLKETTLENHLAEGLKTSLGKEQLDLEKFDEEDPLYEEAKKTVIEARKASASLLQRRLRVGYARAARLLDILESNGIVGPGEGAKPREILFKTKQEEEEDDWQKV